MLNGKRNTILRIAVAGLMLAALVPMDAAPQAQQKKPTAREKLATINYLVGTWSCGHTVGDFSGKYTTKYTKVMDDLWLKQTYDFPPRQFGSNERAVTAEALIGYDEEAGQWVRFFATSHGEYFSIRMKETPSGWAYQYISFFRNVAQKSEADATFMKKSDTEYEINGPTYPDNGKMVTEHHTCHKL